MNRRFALLYISLLAPVFAFAQADDFDEEDLPTVLRAGNQIAAKVEGKIITVEEIRREMAPLMRQVYSASATTDEFHANIRSLSRDVLQNLVDRILIVKDFRDRQFSIPKSYIESEFNKVIEEDFNGDRSRFLTYLKSQDQTVRDFRNELEEKIIVDAMRQQMRRSQAEISPEKIEDYYQANLDSFEQEAAVRLRQIVLIRKPGETDDTLSERARSIARKLAAGADFSDLAREYSEDGMARRGGDYGWIQGGDIRPELAEVAFSLPVETASEPILLDNAAFILRVEEKRSAGPQPLAEVREEIERSIQDELAREAQVRWIERLREKAFIEYYI